MKWSILDKKLLYRGFFTLKSFDLKHDLFDGGESKLLVRELLDRGQAAAVLPYDPVRDEVVLIEQFRIGAYEDPTGPWLIEVVAGLREPGENTDSAYNCRQRSLPGGDDQRRCDRFEPDLQCCLAPV